MRTAVKQIIVWLVTEMASSRDTVKLRIDAIHMATSETNNDAMAYFIGTNFWIRVLGGPTSVTYKLPFESRAMRSTKSSWPA
jgi:cobalamin biosynthesis protein CobD/CbiB